MKRNEIAVERMSANKRIRGMGQRNGIFQISSGRIKLCNKHIFYFILAFFAGWFFCLSVFICLYCCI